MAGEEVWTLLQLIHVFTVKKLTRPKKVIKSIINKVKTISEGKNTFNL